MRKDENCGHLHPISSLIREANLIFLQMGFTLVEGPLLESEWYNFDALNFPKDHPLHAGYDAGQAIRDADVILVVAAAAPWDPQQTGPRPDAKGVFIDEQALYQQLPFWNYRADMIMAADALSVLGMVVEKVLSSEGLSIM